MNIDKRDILATSVRNVEELKRRYDLDKEGEKTDLSDYLKSDILPISVENGGTGVASFTSGTYLMGNGTNPLQEKTTEEVASDIKQYLEVDTSNLVIKPTLLWSNASPTSAFSAQTVTLSQSIENFTHFSVMYGTYKASLGLLHTGLIPKDKLAVLQANRNYISYRNCSISANKATFTDTTYQWDFGGSGSRGTNEFYCMPIYIYGWNL